MAAEGARPALGPLDTSGSGPLYRQVKRELMRSIEDGRYAPGQTLPSETAIATSLGVSIGTLRRAVDEMVHEGLLVRRQGRGTFVALHGRDRYLFQFFHVEPRAEPALGRPLAREYPLVECLGFLRGRADEPEAAALRVRVGDAVIRIDNRLSLSGRPVVHDRVVVAAGLFKGLTEKRFRERPGTIYQFYQTDYGITVLQVRERARAVAAGREAARVLGVPSGTPVIEAHRVALSFGERPVEYRVSTIDTAAHDYVTLLSRGA